MEGYRREPSKDDIRGEVCEVQDRSRRKDIKKEKTSAEKQGEIGETLGGLSDGIERKTYLHEPNDIRENAETALSCR